MRKICLLILSAICFFGVAGNGIAFKENKNQWPSTVLFGADYKSTHFFVNENGFNFCVYDGNDINKAQQARHEEKAGNTDVAKHRVKGHNYNVVFNGASFLNCGKLKPLQEYYNYFIGNDESKWAGNVKAYEELLFSNVYPNIDLKLYSNKGSIKYDLMVKPQADISQIEVHYESVAGLTLRNGNLMVETSVGVITEQKPYAYQFIKGKKVEVICNYELKDDNTVVYVLPNGYNTHYELIIDPTIIVCSYSNSLVWSNCSGATYDLFGNIFVQALCENGYPSTPGAFQLSHDSLLDDIITKYNATGTAKIFTTYLGGNDQDILQNIVVTNSDITIFGYTHSSNFPVTTGVFDTSYNDTAGNHTDFFISKLNLNGSALIASTYIGGSNSDGINTLAISSDVSHFGNMLVDKQGNIYVCSSTNSTDFPVTTGTYQIAKNGTNVDNIVFKLDSTLQTLVYSTYVGGTSVENAFYSKLVNGNELLISGTTGSANFPTTPGSYNPIKNGGRDIYVLHLNATGTGIIASTFIGTTGNDFGYFIDTDLNNDVYVSAHIGLPASFTSTPGLYNVSSARSAIIKLNSNLSSVIYQTKFGTANFYENLAFKVDSCQNIYLSGIVTNGTYPVTADKFQNYNHGSELYITVFSTNMLSLKFASYFGGKNDEHTDGGTSYFSDKGILYQGICVNKGNLPTTAGAYQTTYPTTDTLEYNDGFVKIDLQNFIKANSSYGTGIKGCAPFEANFNSFTNTGGTSTWNFGDGSSVSHQANTSHMYNAVGNYTVTLIANDSTTCNKTDTVRSIMEIINPADLKITGNSIICDNQSLILKAETNDFVAFTWNTGATTNTISVETEGIYTVTANNGGCDTKETIAVTYLGTTIDALFPNVITPNNDRANDIINLNKFNFTKVSFCVFDRWGLEIFKTEKTDAIFNPENCNDGTYFYTLNYTTACGDSEIKTKGFITVFK
ncbi:MAG: gliding motility-associated C-terminal domain-containing protein [Bacteroidota bacterium]